VGRGDDVAADDGSLSRCSAGLRSVRWWQVWVWRCLQRGDASDVKSGDDWSVAANASESLWLLPVWTCWKRRGSPEPLRLWWPHRGQGQADRMPRAHRRERRRADPQPGASLDLPVARS